MQNQSGHGKEATEWSGAVTNPVTSQRENPVNGNGTRIHARVLGKLIIKTSPHVSGMCLVPHMTFQSFLHLFLSALSE